MFSTRTHTGRAGLITRHQYQSVNQLYSRLHVSYDRCSRLMLRATNKFTREGNWKTVHGCKQGKQRNRDATFFFIFFFFLTAAAALAWLCRYSWEVGIRWIVYICQCPEFCDRAAYLWGVASGTALRLLLLVFSKGTWYDTEISLPWPRCWRWTSRFFFFFFGSARFGNPLMETATRIYFMLWWRQLALTSRIVSRRGKQMLSYLIDAPRELGRSVFFLTEHWVLETRTETWLE